MLYDFLQLIQVWYSDGLTLSLEAYIEFHLLTPASKEYNHPHLVKQPFINNRVSAMFGIVVVGISESNSRKVQCCLLVSDSEQSAALFTDIAAFV